MFVVVFVFWLIAVAFLTQFLTTGVALSVSLLLAAGAGWVARSLQKRQKQLRRQRYRLWLAGQKCREEIKNLKTREELTVFVSLLLARLPQFTDLRVNQKKGEKNLQIDENIALSAKYKDVPIAMQCLPPAASGQEEVKLLRNFQKALAEEALARALIVVPGKLHPEARRVIAGLRKNYRVVTLNEERLVELAFQAGRGAEEGNLREGAREDATGEKGEKKVSPDQLLLAPQKGLNYLLAAGVLWFISYLSSPAGLLNSLYLALIAGNVALALACFLLNNADAYELEDLEP